MDTSKKMREHISALSDDALPAPDVELALAALRGTDGVATWGAYHRIGDVLRAHAGPDLSDSFNARLAEKLDAEAAKAEPATALP